MKQTNRATKVEKIIDSSSVDNQEADLLRSMVSDADNYHALKIVMESEGGELLVKTLISDVVRSINRLERFEGMSRDELVAICARLSTDLNLARSMTRAATNLKDVDERLDEALRL